MNAKSIKLGLFALAGVSILASCSSKGTSMTRAEAEKELDAIAAKTITTSKVTYSKGWEKTGNNHAVVDKDNVYAYRKVDSAIVTVEGNVTVTLYAAGTEAFVYQDGDKYIVAYNDGTSKKYFTTSKDVAVGYVDTFLTALDGYANGKNGQAAGTSYWLKGFDKTEAATGKKELTVDDLNSLSTDCTVKGYIGKESYTKYADGEMTADITAMYPYQQSLMDQGGENCIYEFKNYQLTRLYNNYQKYEEKFDWASADTSAKISTADYTLVESATDTLAVGAQIAAIFLAVDLAPSW